MTAKRKPGPPKRRTRRTGSARAANSYDLQLIDTMTAHHRDGIEMAELAEVKGSRAELKELAREIVEGETLDVRQMAEMREEWYPGKPKAVNPNLPGVKESKPAAAGEAPEHLLNGEFDAGILQAMVPHHEGGIVLAQDGIDRGKHPEIRRFMQRLMDRQQREVDKMKQWLDDWQSGT